MLDHDKNGDGVLQLTEFAGDKPDDRIYYRLMKSADRHNGNGDGEVSEAEWDRSFEATEAGGLVATRLGGQGDVSKDAVRWRVTKSLPYVTSALVRKNVLYVVRDGGILTSYDASTGAVLTEARLEKAIGQYYASPVAAADRLYLVSKEGKLTTVRTGAKWEVVSSADLDDEVIATPAIANGRLFVRTRGTLYCFAKADGER
jgi:outer membrane protein assembly factor BamB